MLASLQRPKLEAVLHSHHLQLWVIAQHLQPQFVQSPLLLRRGCHGDEFHGIHQSIGDSCQTLGFLDAELGPGMGVGVSSLAPLDYM